VQEIGLPKEAYLQIGLVAAIPWGIAAIVMVLWARNSDRTGERQWHGALAILLSMIGLLMLAWGGHGPVVSMIALTLVATGAMAWLAVFWTLPTAFLSGVAAAGGIAWINALSQLGGFVGPDMLGRLRESGGDAVSTGFTIMAVAALATAILTWFLAGSLRKSQET